MSEPCREMTLKELVEAGNYEVIQKRFDNQERLQREYEERVQAQVYELTNKLKRQIEEKEETIQSLLKCIRILGN